jgi:UDP-glucose 4-epimerase
MQTVLVTGGAGFIGSHITKELSRKGYDVRILDNLSSGRKENLKEINAEIINGDIRDFSVVKKSLKGVDCVFHEAAMASVTKSIEDPILSDHVNVDGTLNVLVAAKDSGCKKVVFASSSSVYGNPIRLPISESHPLNPLTPYAVTKLVGEHYCRVFYENYGLESVCLRYFNVYGPRQDPKSEYAAVVPKFISSIKNNRQPMIFGDGNQTRDFVFINDVVQANILSMKHAGFGIFNVGSGSKTTVNELAEKIGRAMNSIIHPTHTGERKGDVRDSMSDITHARKVLGFSPKYTLEDGLKETIRTW